MARTVTTRIQPRFADFDIFHHANNVAQQSFLDVGKVDYYARLLGERMLSGRVRVVNVSTTTSFVGQIRMHDTIDVVTTCEKVGNKSMTLHQQIVVDGEVRTESRTVMVVFDFEAQQSREVPDEWRARLLAD